jgi:hypothetical protein
MFFTKYHLSDQVKKTEMGRTCGTYGGEVHTGLKRGNLGEGDHFEDPGVDGRIILKWIFERLGVGAQTGLIWLRIGTGGGLLCIR